MKCANCGDPVTDPVTVSKDEWVKTKDGYSDMNQRPEAVNSYELRRTRVEVFCTYPCLIERVNKTERLSMLPVDTSGEVETR